jgi:hypothetical protein
LEAENPQDPLLIAKDDDTKLQNEQSSYVKYIQIFRNLEVNHI